MRINERRCCNPYLQILRLHGGTEPCAAAKRRERDRLAHPPVGEEIAETWVNFP